MIQKGFRDGAKETNPRRVVDLIAVAEQRLIDFSHPEPIIRQFSLCFSDSRTDFFFSEPNNEGGIAWERNIPPPPWVSIFVALHFFVFE